MREAVVILASYLLGSVPFAWILGRLHGVDIRRVGSGNIGATNLGRVLGRRWAIGAFALDFAKGLAAAAAGAGLLGLGGGETGRVPAAVLGLACGGAVILGHVFPLYLGFRGGKGVATAFGVVTVLSPIAAAVSGAAWLAIYSATRTVSLASLAAGLLFPVGVAAWSLWRGTAPAEWLGMEVFAIAIAILITWRHRDNIRRLLHGEELAFRKREAVPAGSTQEEDLGPPR